MFCELAGESEELRQWFFMTAVWTVISAGGPT